MKSSLVVFLGCSFAAFGGHLSSSAIASPKPPQRDAGSNRILHVSSAKAKHLPKTHRQPSRETRPVSSQAVFYVSSHGWHTGIVVPRTAIPPGTWPPGVAKRDFAGCRYLELGWGDRQFYPASHPNALMALDAIFLPGPSVLHVAGFEDLSAHAPTWNALVAIPCTDAELASLCRSLGGSFMRDAKGRAQPLGPGLYGQRSQFYAANGKYWLVNNCNPWTARMMRAGGLPADPSPCASLTAGKVVSQARRLTLARKQERGLSRVEPGNSFNPISRASSNRK